jgi:hypothetical protein
VPLLPKDIRSIRPGHKWVVAILALGWTVTIIGGYALGWKWTGYPGSTLWDWLRLLLLPLIVPTLLIPVLRSRISGRGTQPDHDARAGTPGARPPGPDAAGLSPGIEELSRHAMRRTLRGADWRWVLPLSQLPAGPHQHFRHCGLFQNPDSLARRLAFGLAEIAKGSERGSGVARAHRRGQFLRVLPQIPPLPPVSTPGHR